MLGGDLVMSAANREAKRRYNAIHRERLAAEQRARRAANPETPEETRSRKLYQEHGMRPEDWASLWSAQGGRCYLCGDELTSGRGVHIDHDHSCCRDHRSCSYCRRGLACNNCNVCVGMGGDDPERLRRIADSLEAAKAAAIPRIAAKPVQMTLAGEAG